jgi:hypothetical protein
MQLQQLQQVVSCPATNWPTFEGSLTREELALPKIPSLSLGFKGALRL